MFGKLLKHEFKATGRTLLPLYGGFVALVLAASGMLWLAWRFGEVHVNGSTAIVQGNTIFGILSGVFTLVAVFAMLAIVIVTEVLIIMRFYRLLGDDGYFWFSLHQNRKGCKSRCLRAQNSFSEGHQMHPLLFCQRGAVCGRHLRIRAGGQ